MKPIILLSLLLLVRSISMAQVTGFEIDDSKFDKQLVA